MTAPLPLDLPALGCQQRGDACGDRTGRWRQECTLAAGHDGDCLFEWVDITEETT